MMLIGVFAMYTFWLGFITIVLYAAYRLVAKLLDKSLDVKREQNLILEEFTQVIKQRNQTGQGDPDEL